MGCINSKKTVGKEDQSLQHEGISEDHGEETPPRLPSNPPPTDHDEETPPRLPSNPPPTDHDEEKPPELTSRPPPFEDMHEKKISHNENISPSTKSKEGKGNSDSHHNNTPGAGICHSWCQPSVPRMAVSNIQGSKTASSKKEATVEVKKHDDPGNEISKPAEPKISGIYKASSKKDENSEHEFSKKTKIETLHDKMVGSLLIRETKEYELIDHKGKTKSTLIHTKTLGDQIYQTVERSEDGEVKEFQLITEMNEEEQSVFQEKWAALMRTNLKDMVNQAIRNMPIKDDMKDANKKVKSEIESSRMEGSRKVSSNMIGHC